MPETTTIAIKNEALRLGFTACGFAQARHLEEDEKRFREWLDKEMYGSMGYMANYFEKRTDPRKLVPGAKSVVSLLLNYYPEKTQEDPEAPVLSKYAYGIDYHFIMKDRMKRLLTFMNDHFGPVEGRVFVDTAPVLDRAWAVQAGLGWIGKNSMLISRHHGSFVFIGEIITNLELDYNTIPESDFCGSCTRCIEACPTGAINLNRTIDARKCISYLTIENRDKIPESYRDQMENRVFGCDICQDVCPWNRKSTPNQVEEFTPAPSLLAMSEKEWIGLDRTRFNQLFKKSAVKRAGYKGLRRNIDFLPGKGVTNK